MATAAVDMINTRKMRYTGQAMAGFKTSEIEKNLKTYQSDGGNASKEATRRDSFSDRPWMQRAVENHPPVEAASGRNTGGEYPMTSNVAPWVMNALENYRPDQQVLDLVGPFSQQLHEMIEKERKASTGLHDLNIVELTYQITLEVGAAILQAADATDDPVIRQSEFHSSQAARDDHFAPWGKLLCGIDTNPPIIAMFPVYLMFCQSFTFTPNPLREDYVYSALTGVDWAQGKNKFSEKLAAFEKLARSSINIDDGQDRCFWRISQAYIRAMNECENARSFQTPRKAAIVHDLGLDLVIAFRGIDTIGSAYMANDGAAWLDNPGIDSLVGSAVPNDIMDLHTDIKTGETRNLLRLMFPDGLTMTQAMLSVSTVLSGQLCELFRGHHRARFGKREDGRISATSPPYSFCRARHRSIFKTMEAYIAQYPQFWDWTWEIYGMAKQQVTQAGLSEPLISALKRSVTRESLETSPENPFYEIYYEMIEDGHTQLAKKNPLGVSVDLAEVTREIHSLWHEKLLDRNKLPGWGDEFDAESDRLFGQAGEILLARGDLSDDVYKFAIAYGRLSMALPYIAYHTIDAIIMANGVVD